MTKASFKAHHPTDPVDSSNLAECNSDWNNIVPIGREFGSPDYERLEELDNLACKAIGTLSGARSWLDTPLDELGGLAPEAVAKTPEGLELIKKLLSHIG